MSVVDVTEAKAALSELAAFHAEGWCACRSSNLPARVEAALRVLVEQVEAQTAENEKLREALFQVFANLGEDTDGITSGAEFDAHVTPKLADMVPRLVAEYRADMERETDDADAEIQRLRAAQPHTEQWEERTEPFKPMADRVREAGAYDGPKDLTSVISDIYRVASTLLQGSGGDYCACQMFPCECVEVFMDDLASCVAIRHPEAPQPADEFPAPNG